MYLSYDDIEKLHDRNEELFRQVKNSQNLTPEQIAKECETLSKKYDFEVEKLCELREAEYLQQQAAIEAKNGHRIPWRRGWWWRLFFRPTTNRAQNIIEERAALDAEEYFDKEEKELEARAEKIYSDQEQSSEAPTAPAAVADVQNDAEQQQPAVDIAEPPEPPIRKPRKTT